MDKGFGNLDVNSKLAVIEAPEIKVKILQNGVELEGVLPINYVTIEQTSVCMLIHDKKLMLLLPSHEHRDISYAALKNTEQRYL
jgi:hypothetical protein